MKKINQKNECIGSFTQNECIFQKLLGLFSWREIAFFAKKSFFFSKFNFIYIFLIKMTNK